MRIRDEVLDANPLGVLCLEQGLTVAAREVDHILPLHRGGTDARENLRGLCIPCHTALNRQQMAARLGRMGHDADGVPLARLRPGAGVKS